MSIDSNAGQAATARSSKKWFALGAAALLLVVAAGVTLWYVLVKSPYDAAVSAFQAEMVSYDEAAAELAQRTGELDTTISSLQAVIDSDDEPLDPELLISAGAAIGEAQGVRAEGPAAPVMPEATEEIVLATAAIPDLVATFADLGVYDDEIATLQQARQSLEQSIEQRKQVTEPTEAFVIERVQSLPTVAGVQAVTEDNDPNGNLNKQGGYTATVYLSSSLVDQSSVSGGDIVARGTEGGGAIEVYATSEEATARDAYLGAFDGGILSSGSHTVLGTVVVRTSDLLTASQQQELERAIVESLIRID